jgi:hypothetical protein
VYSSLTCTITVPFADRTSRRNRRISYSPRSTVRDSGPGLAFKDPPSCCASSPLHSLADALLEDERLRRDWLSVREDRVPSLLSPWFSAGVFEVLSLSSIRRLAALFIEASSRRLCRRSLEAVGFLLELDLATSVVLPSWNAVGFTNLFMTPLPQLRQGRLASVDSTVECFAAGVLTGPCDDSISATTNVARDAMSLDMVRETMPYYDCCSSVTIFDEGSACIQ